MVVLSMTFLILVNQTAPSNQIDGKFLEKGTYDFSCF